ncbi:hypothetical protein BJ138DRAFT_169724 [Hygrophoropsis aurantiaca]|uniref:Uncharacterized protein n=1 Tax=Hygrophoropsis aurantiaca TaxID=72124 RepID=A0ACB8AA34_9AGAM|nr:hypothetical protein BJ138DRAFT_169724 [Hygrophoropsis aurantiaca]
MSTLLSSISETIVLLLNTPIVPPVPTNNRAGVQLTDLPHRRRTGMDRGRSGDLTEDAFGGGGGETFVLGRPSEESLRTTTTGERTSGESGGLRDDVPAGFDLVHGTHTRSPQEHSDSEHATLVGSGDR